MPVLPTRRNARAVSHTGQVSQQISTGLLRSYRFFAYTTGVLLVTLTVVSLPSWIDRLVTAIQGDVYTGHTPEWLALLWTAHGWFYMGYLITGFVIAYKLRFTVLQGLLVLLAGTIPAMSFVAERWVVGRIGASAPATEQDSPSPTPPARSAG